MFSALLFIENSGYICQVFLKQYINEWTFSTIKNVKILNVFVEILISNTHQYKIELKQDTGNHIITIQLKGNITVQISEN